MCAAPVTQAAFAAQRSVYSFSARPLAGGEPVCLGSLRGKVLLIENMNDLQQRLGPQGLVVLGFPCNQFGHQENAKNEEILNSLKYVRPGGGFEPNFMLFEKCEVNGKQAHPLFAFLREALPAPSDDPKSLMTDPKFITWSPVCRNDVSWNFEKFLVGRDGVPVRRYSRRFPTIDIESDIQALLSQGSGSA
ncbi:Glutathione peroxidase 1 [Galemys pyrenaicus]|uniref:Glutathione peroxidase 1 n=1 Tax=Galemys pyrenaicus TaxID=202257 RepID=A0A8J6DW11_GALPY|nr:Glutathione peroxidase 1 [Galemys pyrenaicus]